MISRLISLSIAIGALIASTLAAAAPSVMQAQLEGIADGDTIYVRDTEQNASYRVRLAMIDAPESAQDYGIESKAALQQLLRGAGLLTLHVDSSDRYGRLIALVKDERNRNINLEMVSQGAAWVYTQYAKRGAFGDQYSFFSNAERQARIRQIGLWRNPEPIEPWRFRR
ncbi:thermonuclease family protein [Stutzerimonas stutzeri]|uniref:thermonuclease family protein n=1 Tax=Stutzerimonas stutzeri TaxID=316 RepID=UPI0015E43732|nr:thermonuclease family protein [Stutzerimonas stutzeri]MBA1280413.1 thermonuclease family protein [Stutzerimonas stutzeri]